MAVSTSFTLYLSPEGNSVEIKNFRDGATIPQQLEASACKTHEQVLSFLLKIKESAARGSLSYAHHNSSYGEHLGTWPKGPAHSCSLEKQIDFVRYKIREKAYASNDSIKEMSTPCLQAVIDDLQDKLKQARLTTTFWGTRKISVPNETEIRLDTMARLVTKLYNQCTLGERNLNQGVQNYAQNVVDTVHAFYRTTDTQIANSNIFKKTLVWFRELFERNFIYTTRWWVEFNHVE